jgi:hypothetical protein
MPRLTALKWADWMLVVPISIWPEASAGVCCAPDVKISSWLSMPSSRK